MRMRELRHRTIQMLWRPRIGVLLGVMSVTALFVVVPLETKPATWLPDATEAGSLLGALLSAQAAIAALTLAVTLFVMQGVGNRRDANDEMYQEYIRRSRAREIFVGSVVAVGLTGATLLLVKMIGEDQASDAASGVRNLTPVAGLAFLGNLALPLVLFERALRLVRPDEWRRLRRTTYERAMRDAVMAFRQRFQRVQVAREADEPDLSGLFPDAAERSADEPIRALLDDARSAMAERRQADFTRSLDSIEELVVYAMDEVRLAGFDWSPPGSQAEWPPLWGLGRNLYSFREDVIRQGNRDYALALLKLDYGLFAHGARSRCGELFTASLQGYRWNYKIALQVGNSELRDIFRNRIWDNAWAVIDVADRDALLYMREMVRHQERLLHDVIEANVPTEYELLQKGFANFLRNARLGTAAANLPGMESVDLFDRVNQDYRIALMGLGGRALILAESGRVTDPRPYIELALKGYGDLQRLAKDAVQALNLANEPGLSLWSQWEMEGAEGEARIIQSERYPLTFFCLALLEFVAGPMPPLDLKGSAQRVFDWFTANASRLERHVSPSPDSTLDEKRDRVVAALEDAVKRDEVNKDLDVARWQLSTDKVANFKAGVHASAVGASTVEHLFKRAGAFRHLESDARDGPKAREVSSLVPKEFLADVPKRARTHYEPLRGGPFGQGLARDIVKSLCEALAGAPPVTSQLDSSDELLRVIGEALAGLGPSGEKIVLLLGDWSQIIGELSADSPAGYEPIWREDGWPAVVARYLGHTVLFAGDNDPRQLYIVEPKSWGCFVRAQTGKDNDLTVEVTEVSQDMAKKLLGANPNHFPDEPDEAAKLRKLQAHVGIRAVARVGFDVTDPSRARRVVNADE